MPGTRTDVGRARRRLLARLRGPRLARLGTGLCLGLGFGLGLGPGLAGCAPEPPSVVWIVVDALSARHTSLHGGPERTTPYLEQLAAESVVVERAYAQAPMTLRSASSYLTGLLPDDAAAGTMRRAGPDLASRLAAAGYATAAFSENPWVSATTGFDAGFDAFRSFETPPGRPRGERDNAATVAEALAWFRAAGPGPRFLYLHLLPPHAPYAPPRPFRFRRAGRPAGRGGAVLRLMTGGRVDGDGGAAPLDAFLTGTHSLDDDDLAYLYARYLENVTYADHLVRTVVEPLRDAGELDDTLVVVTADHGEAFGPHAELFHGGALYDSQIRVPLLLRLPASLGVSPGRRPDGTVELVDLVPTLLEAAGLAVPADLPGESLLPWLRGQAPPPALARAFLDDAQAAVAADWKLIRGPEGMRLFDLGRDPDEQDDRAADHPGEVARLAADLVDRAAPSAREDGAPVSPERRAELEALGYAVPSPGATGPAPTATDAR